MGSIRAVPVPAGLDDLSRGPRSFASFAEKAGWYLVATLGGMDVEVRRGQRKEEWTWETARETSTQIRGWRGDGQFVICWHAVPGKTAETVCYWWTRDHSATVKGIRVDEVVTWRSDRPEPVKVSGPAELKKLLAP